MNSKEAQGYLEGAKMTLKKASCDVNNATDFLLMSIASSLLVIAAVVTDIEFKDEEEQNGSL